jgi:hypothetical protein
VPNTGRSRAINKFNACAPSFNAAGHRLPFVAGRRTVAGPKLNDFERLHFAGLA